MNAVTTKPMTNKQRSKDARKTRAFEYKMTMNAISDESDLAMCRFWYETAMRELTYACKDFSTPKYRRDWMMNFLMSRKFYIDRATRLKTADIKVMRLPN